MPRGLKALGNIFVATAGSFLAYLLAEITVLHAPILLLAAITNIEVVGFQPQPRFPYFLPSAMTRLPPEAPVWLYASAARQLLAGSVAAHRCRRDRSTPRPRLVAPAATQAVLWATFFLAFYSGAFGGGRFRLQRALEGLWPTFAQSEGRVLFLGGALIGVGLFAAWVCLRGLLDRTADSRLARFGVLVSWIMLPALLVGGFLVAYLFNWRLLGRSGPAAYLFVWITAPILAAGLPAALWRARPAPPLELRHRSAFALCLLAALTLGGLAARGEILSYFARRQLTARSSLHWRLYLDAAALPRADALAGAADHRVAKMAERLSIALSDEPLRGCLFASTQSKTALTGSDEPFTLDAVRQEIHHLLLPAGDVSDGRGDALLLMREAWGEPGSQSVALAVARYAAGEFGGQPLRDYAGRIAREETAYSLREALALESDYLSPLVRDALAGAWVERMVERRGKAILPVLYGTRLDVGKEAEFARALGADWNDLEQDWRSYLLGRAADPPPQPPPPRSPFFKRGISFSHEVGGGWGYGPTAPRKSS
jgi:hypothetical protein